ncbi:DUF4263 domain-containing protein [Candidatus Microgenomates bacterium]|nr:DUF4263 domain-containing protein [Candidatus Microgenomates bacterium]
MAKRKVYKLTTKRLGKRFFNYKIFYSGFRTLPKELKKDGTGFAGLKHLLETLIARFGKFDLVLVNEKHKSKIVKRGKKYFTYLSTSDLKLFKSEKIQKSREVTLKVAYNFFSVLYPHFFENRERYHSYEPGLFSEILTKDFRPAMLSQEDIKAISKFNSRLFSHASGEKLTLETAYESKRDIQLLLLEKLISEFDNKITKHQSEAKWQDYFRKNILLFQEGYIQKIEKQNVDVDIKFPDFSVMTMDSYLDVIEIKTPDTKLLSYDSSHDNHYWNGEISKAIAQVEKYLDSINKNADRIRNIIEDKYGLKLRIIKPRGILIAGLSIEYSANPFKSDDFRLLNDGLKNMTVIPYDDLSKRLKNTLTLIKDIPSKKLKRKKK